MNDEPQAMNRSSDLGPGTSVVGDRSSDFGDLSDAVIGRRSSTQAGIVYIGLLLAIVLIGIATAVLTPMYSTMVQRDKEAELLFRLGEFRRAIGAYRQDHGRYPAKLEELLEDKTQLQVRRHLRRIYPDPMTGAADWKLELIVDKTGTVAGIRELHSQSNAKGFMHIPDKGNRYSDW
jgi:type II secretory pathway pseudopilin PulG